MSRRACLYYGLAAAVWLMVWQVGAGLLDSFLLPTPLAVLKQLVTLWQTADFWAAVLWSLCRIALGFFAAVLAAMLLCALSAQSKLFRTLLFPLMQAIKAVPVASFVILALLWVKSRGLPLLISFLMVLPVVYSNLMAGVAALDTDLQQMATVFRISRLRRLRWIVLPQLAPFFRTGCALALGLCWKAGIAAEVIGMPDGSIGAALQQAKVYLDTPSLFAWTVTVVLLSIAFEKLVLFGLDQLAARLIGGRLYG